MLAEFICSQADGLTDAWPSLLKDTPCEDWERGQNKIGAADWEEDGNFPP